MLANFEQIKFENEEMVWLGRYRNLKNILHWHHEYEIIRITKGRAEIMINNKKYHAESGQIFFCGSKAAHYISGDENSIIDIIIFNGKICGSLLQMYELETPLVKHCAGFEKCCKEISRELKEKDLFYSEMINNSASRLVLDIFRNEKTVKRSENLNNSTKVYENVIEKISNEYRYITFEEAVKFSGYSEAYFSKLFKKASGFTFSQYLNIIKVENAISMINNRNKSLNITEIALRCGFSTIRNFNRVFKDITGYAPKDLPDNFISHRNMKISNCSNFDPTLNGSELIDIMDRTRIS